MLKWLLNRGARTFGKKYNYDVSYMLEMNDQAPEAGARFALFPLISQYRGPKAGQGVWAGALLASTLEGDCGPCAQLCIDMALEAGADASAIELCLKGEAEKAGDFGLGYRFAMASIKADTEADTLRQSIEDIHGPKTVIAASFAAAAGRFYPVLKRGMGHGLACQKLRIGADRIELAAA
ncbi:MAG: hypothetical protein AAGB16_07590 [Pseudomonadota bacterium]